MTLKAALPIVMHRDPGCGCCEQWAAHVRQQFGRHVNIVDDRQSGEVQRTQAVSARLSSCLSGRPAWKSQEVRPPVDVITFGAGGERVFASHGR